MWSNVIIENKNDITETYYSFKKHCHKIGILLVTVWIYFTLIIEKLLHKHLKGVIKGLNNIYKTSSLHRLKVKIISFKRKRKTEPGSLFFQ